MLLSNESDGLCPQDEGEDEQHYVLINNLSRLVGMQTNKHNGKTHICINCFNKFSLEKSFKEHMEVCLSNDSVKIEMPKKGSTIEFKNYVKKLKVPFVIYADFESYTERVSKEQGKKHKTSSVEGGEHCKQSEWTQGKQCEHCSSCKPKDTTKSQGATKSYTEKYQKHTPVGFAITLCIVVECIRLLLYTQDQMPRKSFANILKRKRKTFTTNTSKMKFH